MFDLMKGNNDHAKIAVNMVKGQRSFDPKAVAASFDQWAHTAKGEKNRASPRIWENKKDFDAKVAAFARRWRTNAPRRWVLSMA
jgi:cytochrome c556